ncbi:MAG: type II toxin-antitoxin system HicB family antitoxin [Lachnospiraceae bacterium]|nr:type II toxin-antitoxin system HicB family antitoxin [Lachnospiraceae bacterium]
MKTIDDYIHLSYKLEVIGDPDEGGYVVSYPDLPGCISSGETIEEAVNNIHDAKKAWIEAALEDGVNIPEPRLT